MTSEHNKHPNRDAELVQVEAEITRICSEARVGKYLNLQKLDAIDFSARIGNYWAGYAELTRKGYEMNIADDGEEAISHLCLPARIHSRFMARGVDKISVLQEIIQKKMLLHVPGVYPQDVKTIEHLYQEWEALEYVC